MLVPNVVYQTALHWRSLPVPVLHQQSCTCRTCSHMHARAIFARPHPQSAHVLQPCGKAWQQAASARPYSTNEGLTVLIISLWPLQCPVRAGDPCFWRQLGLRCSRGVANPILQARCSPSLSCAVTPSNLCPSVLPGHSHPVKPHMCGESARYAGSCPFLLTYSLPSDVQPRSRCAKISSHCSLTLGERMSVKRG